MADLPRSCLEELHRFHITYAHSTDLFATAKELLSYGFGPRSLKDVFTKALTDESLTTECRGLASTFVREFCSDLTACVSAVSGKESLTLEDKRLVTMKASICSELAECRSLSGLFNAEDDILLDGALRSFVELTNSKPLFGDNSENLPPHLQAHLKMQEDCRPNVHLPLFNRDLFTRNTSADKIESKITFVDSLKKVLSSGDITLTSLRALCDEKVGSDESGDLELVGLDSILSTWATLFEHKDGQMLKAFAQLLRKYFFYLSIEQREKAMIRMLQRNRTKDLSTPAELITLFPGIDQETIKCIGQLGSHTFATNEPEKFARLQDELLWFIFLAPQETVFRLVNQAIQNKAVAPTILKILRQCSSLLQYDRRLLLNVISRVYSNDLNRWSNVEDEESFAYSVSSLCKRKRQAVKEKSENGEVVERAGAILESEVLDASLFIVDFVLPNIFSNRQHLRLMLQLLNRVFINTTTRDSEIKWSTSLPDGVSDSVSAPEVIIILTSLLLEEEFGDASIADLCKQTIRSLAYKLREDSVLFNDSMSSFLSSQWNKAPWFVKYSFCKWFSSSLPNLKVQLPTGVFKSLSMEDQEDCEQLTTDFPSSATNCFLRSIFELALFSPELAMGIIDKVVVRPLDDDLLEKMCVAFILSCAQPYSSRRLASLAPVITLLVKKLDPSSNELSYVGKLSSVIMDNWFKIRHILFIASAVKAVSGMLSLELKNEDGASSNSGNFADILFLILQAFCELTKSHVESELILVRKTVKENAAKSLSPPIELCDSLLVQLSLLFNESCLFTTFAGSFKPLAILLPFLVDAQMEVQKLCEKKNLDSLSYDERIDATYYVYATDGNNKPKQDEKRVASKGRLEEGIIAAASKIRSSSVKEQILARISR